MVRFAMDLPTTTDVTIQGLSTQGPGKSKKASVPPPPTRPATPRMLDRRSSDRAPDPHPAPPRARGTPRMDPQQVPTAKPSNPGSSPLSPGDTIPPGKRSVPAGRSSSPGGRSSPSAPPPSSATSLGGGRPEPDLRPGATIGDKYRIEREIGRGGFGVVVRARHLTLDQRVAIKVLTEGEGSTEAEFAEDAARFRQEARATAALKSEYVVRVLDVDVLPSGYPYIVMEYLEGQTLHDLVYTRGPLSVEDAVDYTLQVLAALAEAHAIGIVHRDLKPANVLLAKAPGGTTKAKVLDFGVSKMLGAASQRLTRTGAVVGTVAYMAPEQMLDAKRVDGRADLWSAGLILYEALARSHPWGDTSGARVVTAILNEPLIPLQSIRQDVPPKLELIIARLLEKDPAKRYATASKVAKALAPFAPVRSRAVLDAIWKSPAPNGAAASEDGGSPRDSRTPPAAKSTPSQAGSRSRSRSRSSRARVRRRSRSWVMPLLLSLIAVLLVVGAGYASHGRSIFDPHWLRGRLRQVTGR
jgi:serine/threonine-protein kinase